MNKWLIVITGTGILTLAAISFAVPGLGQQEQSDGGDEIILARALDNPKVMEKIGLNDEQVKSLQELSYAAKKRHISLRAEVSQAKLEVRRLLSQDEPNEDAIMLAIDVSGKATTALRKSHVKHMLDGRALVGKETWRDVRKTMRHMKRKQQKGSRSMHHRSGRRPGSGPAGHGTHKGNSSRPPRHQPSFYPSGPGPDSDGGPAMDIASTDMPVNPLNEMVPDWPDDARTGIHPNSLFSTDEDF